MCGGVSQQVTAVQRKRATADVKSPKLGHSEQDGMAVDMHAKQQVGCHALIFCDWQPLLLESCPSYLRMDVLYLRKVLKTA